MLGPRSHLRTLAELLRVSNLPTVITNALVGTVAAAATGAFPWTPFLLVCLAIALLYVSGMIFNDVADAAFDRDHRSERPIPSGRIPRSTAAILGLAAMALGLILLVIISPATLTWGAALAAAILAYDFLHKRVPASVLLMGVCRGLVYVIAAGAVAESVPWKVIGPLALAMTLYITAVTLIARGEHRPGGRVRFPAEVLLLVIALAPAIILHPESWIWPAATGAAAALWIVRGGLSLRRPEPAIGGAVQAWLAGICLIDAFFLTLVDAPPLAVAAAFGLFLVTFAGHRRVAGT